MDVVGQLKSDDSFLYFKLLISLFTHWSALSRRLVLGQCCKFASESGIQYKEFAQIYFTLVVEITNCGKNQPGLTL